jgi:3-deoxy-D-manno-octulosonic-acid transferase
VLRLSLRRRARRGKEIFPRLPERRGIDPTPRPAGRVLWLHAASVGEAVSALPLLSALPADIFTVFTTGTVTSARLLQTRLPQLGLQDRVIHRFVPLDVPGWAHRFLKHWQPDAACFLESELWPNILSACRRRGVPVALVNARLSRSSAANWARVRGFAHHMLEGFAWIAAQSEADAARFRALGAERVEVAGNLKFAAPRLPADPAEVARLQKLADGRPRWLAASTHPADDAVVARVHQALLARHPRLLTAVAPRHPERGAAVAAAMGGAKQRSLGEDFGEADAVWVADTVGEMGMLYRVFPTVFMGKSFFGGGGQNFLEPARLGCAVATGPQTENFAQAREMAVAAGALSVVQNEAALIAWLNGRLGDPRPGKPFEPGGDVAGVMAGRLASLMESSQGGAAAKIPAAGRGGGRAVYAGAGKGAGQPAFWGHGSRSVLPLVLSPASPVVAAATARRVARRGWRAPVPVICCGNAVVGGAGKTTLALDLAHRFLARGLAVHMLTRGYGGSGGDVVLVDARAHDAATVGDEALLLAAVAPTWRGADRAAAAARAVAGGAQVLVMDDGLQNPTLAKTISLLVIDGGFGFGNGRVLPAGPLREPVRAAVARSDAAVLIGPDRAHALDQVPASLKLFLAELVPGREAAALAGQRVVAFAGIGRPEKFFAMLEGAGVEVVERLPFRDHHVFAEEELAGILDLARSLRAVPVTTPKDHVRIGAALKPQFLPVGVSLGWEDERGLEAFLDRALRQQGVL